MTVYVDDAKNDFGRMKMCHLLADTTEELLALVDAIGISRKWIQHQGTWKEHFDISQTKRVLAIEAGARPVTARQMAAMQMRRRIEGRMGTPEQALEWLRNRP